MKRILLLLVALAMGLTVVAQQDNDEVFNLRYATYYVGDFIPIPCDLDDGLLHPFSCIVRSGNVSLHSDGPYNLTIYGSGYFDMTITFELPTHRLILNMTGTIERRPSGGGGRGGGSGTEILRPYDPDLPIEPSW